MKLEVYTLYSVFTHFYTESVKVQGYVLHVATFKYKLLHLEITLNIVSALLYKNLKNPAACREKSNGDQLVGYILLFGLLWYSVALS